MNGIFLDPEMLSGYVHRMRDGEASLGCTQFSFEGLGSLLSEVLDASLVSQLDQSLQSWIQALTEAMQGCAQVVETVLAEFHTVDVAAGDSVTARLETRK
ncbi:hypothetical protein [Canibacter zhoujuaniae]|uniref:hypothetical protein n=1 Tax=Canibacter zhoujuaniae TaxID=2708343 RepID=UPI0014243B1E|nr:hypothetical protein [Canibacter zhoujuaniae]